MSQRLTWQDFGSTMQRLRIRQHVSQDRLAEILGYHRTYIWRLEHGQRLPSKSFIHAFAHACQMTEQDRKLLDAFEQMVVYECQSVEVDGDW